MQSSWDPMRSHARVAICSTAPIGSNSMFVVAKHSYLVYTSQSVAEMAPQQARALESRDLMRLTWLLTQLLLLSESLVVT